MGGTQGESNDLSPDVCLSPRGCEKGGEDDKYDCIGYLIDKDEFMIREKKGCGVIVMLSKHRHAHTHTHTHGSRGSWEE